MCGIVGVINGSKVADHLVSGLRNLEYRGYDSVGIAAMSGGAISRRRASGKISNLVGVLDQDPIDGPVGIGHTRWATHGGPTEGNAHPHMIDGVAVVHNGIIENFKELRAEMRATGRTFQSETDSEVVPALIAHYRESGLDPIQAIRLATSRLEGQFALAVMMEDLPGKAFAARQESPLSVGYGDHETLIASDMMAFAGMAKQEVLLENGDIAVLTNDNVEVFDKTDNRVEREVVNCYTSAQTVGRAGHRHFMHKEMHEQPEVVSRNILRAVNSPGKAPVNVPDAMVEAGRICVVACGTSLYAGMVAQEWFERFAGVKLDLEVASEFRYRTLPMARGDAALFISQSGETADTLASLRMAKEAGAPVVAVVNVPTSAMAREADTVVETAAGPEIGVASTKAFTAQLVALLSVAISIGHKRGLLTDDELHTICVAMKSIPDTMAHVLKQEKKFKKVAKAIRHATSTIFVGRGQSHGLAMEGALKLKEISYIHAEGFAAGELKHGPIALIDENVPAIILAPRDETYQKTLSNAQEIAARDGNLILFSDHQGCADLAEDCVMTIDIGETGTVTTPFAYAVAMQLLAYYTAIAKGTDVDQPRNLAKSVTVE